jgi:uncharacterized protein
MEEQHLTTNPSVVLSARPDGVAVRVKAVPGASRNRIVGVLGDRLKVAVSAPPEGGKANKAICALLAEVFGLAARDVAVTAGAGQPQKTVELVGLNLCAATETLTRLLAPPSPGNNAAT